MNMTVLPGRLYGALPALPSKSHAHRALIAAALSRRPMALGLDVLSEDVLATIQGLSALGAGFDQQGGVLRVTPISAGAITETALVDCGESGSTLRFLLPVAAALGMRSQWQGRGRLGERPLEGLVQALEAHGVRLTGRRLPFTMSGRLRGGEFSLPGDLSSQYLTGLLLALPLLEGDSCILLTTPLVSTGYVELTLAILRRFGVEVLETPDGYAIAGRQTYEGPKCLWIEGDWSGAIYWKLANTLGSAVCVEGLDPRSCQPDRLGVAYLTRLNTPGRVELSFAEAPDLMPALAVAATQGRGVARLTGLTRLRWKESDRPAAMLEGLTRLGARVTEHGDGWEIEGGQRLSGGVVRGYNDHRIVMALAIAATVATGPVIIEGAEAVAKSYPGFWKDFHRVGGQAHVQ